LVRPRRVENEHGRNFETEHFGGLEIDHHSKVRVAPNGDIFVAESEPGRIRVLRAADGADPWCAAPMATNPSTPRRGEFPVHKKDLRVELRAAGGAGSTIFA
jgi:hypothetical protein